MQLESTHSTNNIFDQAYDGPLSVFPDKTEKGCDKDMKEDTTNGGINQPRIDLPENDQNDANDAMNSQLGEKQYSACKNETKNGHKAENDLSQPKYDNRITENEFNSFSKPDNGLFNDEQNKVTPIHKKEQNAEEKAVLSENSENHADKKLQISRKNPNQLDVFETKKVFERIFFFF